MSIEGRLQIRPMLTFRTFLAQICLIFLYMAFIYLKNITPYFFSDLKPNLGFSLNNALVPFLCLQSVFTSMMLHRKVITLIIK